MVPADRPNGENFLIPTNVPLTHASQLQLLAVPLDKITSTLAGTGRMSFVVFDACRNVPLQRETKDLAFKGFAPVREQSGLLVAFATEPGNVAIDQNLYARALADAIGTPGLEAGQVFRRIRLRVRAETGQRQSPEYLDKRDQDFHFASLAPVVPPIPKPATTDRDMALSPFKGFSANPERVDVSLQATPLWHVLKRDYPEWYADRLKEIAALAAENKDDLAIGQQLARALVTLRRQNASAALGASFAQLKAVAATFYENLMSLESTAPRRALSTSLKAKRARRWSRSCRTHLQAQVVAVFEAIADGRKSARAYPQPLKTDYDVLAADLTKRGWTQADLQLFADERALSQAGPEKVCQMVRDWYAAQLALKDPEMQLRLLVDSLKPIVAG